MTRAIASAAHGGGEAWQAYTAKGTPGDASTNGVEARPPGRRGSTRDVEEGRLPRRPAGHDRVCACPPCNELHDLACPCAGCAAENVTAGRGCGRPMCRRPRTARHGWTASRPTTVSATTARIHSRWMRRGLPVWSQAVWRIGRRGALDPSSGARRSNVRGADVGGRAAATSRRLEAHALRTSSTAR